MKTFAIKSYTNYDLVTQIVNANTIEEATKIALDNGAWDGCDVEELDLTKSGLIYSQF